MFVVAAACSGPTTPPPTPPPDPGPQTAPIIRAITVPTSRVEAGVDIALSATVEDAETPLTQLTYQWVASAGTITGSGTTATWTMPKGITSGVDVTVTLTVTDNYQALVNNQLVPRQHVVVGTATPFRVHDSEAELLHLAVKFLRDLFGNSKVPPADCLVDFTDLCADYTYGKTSELGDIVDHRTLVNVISVTFHSSIVTFSGPADGQVYSDASFFEHYLDGSLPSPRSVRNNFVVTGKYHQGRWWICESFVHRLGNLNNIQSGSRGRIGERIKK